MKNKAMLRFVVALILIIAGIALTIMHFCKVVPDGWADSTLGLAIIGVWAYTGAFIGIGMIIGGLNLLGIIDMIIERIQD